MWPSGSAESLLLLCIMITTEGEKRQSNSMHALHGETRGRHRGAQCTRSQALDKHTRGSRRDQPHFGKQSVDLLQSDLDQWRR